MRYSVKRKPIDSHQTAKPISQKSKYLSKYILGLSKVNVAMDFGCGALRYTFEIATICKKLIAVDSQIQLDSIRKFDDEFQTVRSRLKQISKNVNIIEADQFDPSRLDCDFILCANVLPVVPSTKSINKIVSSIRNSLKTRGQCLIVTHYRNEFYRNIKNRNGAIKHLYGWIYESDRRLCYFGIMDKKCVQDIAIANGLKVVRSWTEGESAYVLVAK